MQLLGEWKVKAIGALKGQWKSVDSCQEGEYERCALIQYLDWIVGVFGRQ